MDMREIIAQALNRAAKAAFPEADFEQENFQFQLLSQNGGWDDASVGDGYYLIKFFINNLLAEFVQHFRKAFLFHDVLQSTVRFLEQPLIHGNQQQAEHNRYGRDGDKDTHRTHPRSVRSDKTSYNISLKQLLKI